MSLKSSPWKYKEKFKKFQCQRKEHWNKVALDSNFYGNARKYYHDRVQQVYKNLIPPKSSVMELGCEKGDLLASLSPSHGLGIDFSDEVIRIAREKHPDLHFRCFDIHEIDAIESTYDYIILSDLVNDVWDVQTIFNNLHLFCNYRTRIIINTYSRLWEIPLFLARKLKFAQPTLDQNWLTVPDLTNLLYLSQFECIRNWSEILLPFNLPLLSPFFNKVLVKFWPFRHFALSNFIIARIKPSKQILPEKPPISIVIPARNEAGNIPKIYDSLPNFHVDFELIFVEGHSTDNTYQVIEQQINRNPEVKSMLIKQSDIGKGNAVREGFAKANGDIFMILDADLTVPPEYLPRFFTSISNGTGEFINGVRLVYPMEDRSMQFFNLIGNKIFGLLFSWIIGQPIKDTLCGTKVIRREDYFKISNNRDYFGDFDPFGDFDLLLGAAKINLKIVDVPIRYQERSYGKTNIQRWQHGWLLLKMAWFALRKLKFI